MHTKNWAFFYFNSERNNEGFCVVFSFAYVSFCLRKRAYINYLLIKQYFWWYKNKNWLCSYYQGTVDKKSNRANDWSSWWLDGRWTMARFNITCIWSVNFTNHMYEHKYHTYLYTKLIGNKTNWQQYGC